MGGNKCPWRNESPSCGDLVNYHKGNETYGVTDTIAVGSYPGDAISFGAVDLAGNVRE